ncbi:hypothetical protein NPIL_499921 [Nephila pilipes]|uniref:Uncharacterized protein n=1 Tax=Nephila pilipes TaxID=299642 RepID=A0A8X6P3G1_NEPPI|nr:hypothetical protein NPIL_499921 [Nephila pilipes]
MDPEQMESGESVSGYFQPMSLEQLKIAVDTVNCTADAWAMLGQVLELRTSGRYQVQYFARKDYEAKLRELNELRNEWDPQAKMPLNDGFQVVRRGRQRSRQKILEIA